MRSVARTVILVASTLLAVVLLAAPASAAVCPTPFGSLAKDDPAMGIGEVDTLRAGRHECFDRLVVDIGGPPAGYNVRYVDQVIGPREAIGGIKSDRRLMVSAAGGWWAGLASGSGCGPG